MPKTGNAALLALCALLLVLAVTGGSSQRAALGWTVTFGAGVAAFAVACLTIARTHWETHRPAILLLAAGLLIAGLQLLPLPPEIWQALPGRALLRELDAAAGLVDIWRPLSIAPALTAHTLFQLIVAMAAGLLASQLDGRAQQQLGWLIIAITGLSGLLAVIQGEGHLVGALAQPETTAAASGLFANRNHQALLLAAAPPLLAALLHLNARSSRSRRTLLATGFVVLLGWIALVVFVGSRAGALLLALSVMATITLPAFGVLPASLNRLGALTAGAAALACVAAVLIIGVNADRAVAINRLLQDGAGEDARIYLAAETWALASRYWPAGTGLGTFIPAYAANENPVHLAQAIANQAHNDWLDLILTGGAAGAVLMAAAIAVFILSALRHARAGRAANPLQAAGLVSLFLLGLASLVDYPARTPLLSAIAAIWLVWATAAPRNSSGEP